MGQDYKLINPVISRQGYVIILDMDIRGENYEDISGLTTFKCQDYSRVFGGVLIDEGELMSLKNKADAYDRIMAEGKDK